MSAQLSPAAILTTARGCGMERPVTIAMTWTGRERRRRARGEESRPWAEHAARAVAQGLIGTEDALLSLAFLVGQIADRDPSAWGRATATAAERCGWDFSFASFLLQEAIERIDTRRAVLASEMSRTLRTMLARWDASDLMLATLEQMNAAAGRLFVWPELKQLLADEIARFASRQRWEARRGGR